MLIFVFSVFVVMFAIAGTFVSIEAKWRRDANSARPMPASSNRVAPDGDESKG
jgi:hypothetical protein